MTPSEEYQHRKTQVRELAYFEGFEAALCDAGKSTREAVHELERKRKAAEAALDDHVQTMLTREAVSVLGRAIRAAAR